MTDELNFCLNLLTAALSAANQQTCRVEVVESVLARRRNYESDIERYVDVEGMQLLGEAAIAWSQIQLPRDD
jgi:hypothetical protein